jgi:hypothetical protein
MRGIGRGDHGHSRRNAPLGHAVMHVRGCQQTEAGVMVLGGLSEEEDVAVGPGPAKFSELG